MKKIVTLLLFLSLISSAQSQYFDLIIITNGDSLACYIDSITNTKIYFEMIVNNSWVHTQANRSEIIEYKRNAIDKNEVVFKAGTSYIETLKQLPGGQEVTTKIAVSQVYIITTYPGGEFIGELLFQDAKEVLIETRDRGQVYIPKYQIKEMKEVKSSEFSASGEYMPEEIFATRYFITTNGFPIKKGQSYILWNLYGPDFQFGIGNKFSAGIMTSWLGMPIIGNIKYCIAITEKTNFGISTLLGTGSWAAFDYGLALPFATLTFGNRKNNITFSGGYGAVFAESDSEGNSLFSIAGMAKIRKNMSLVFDSFIMPDVGALLIPGIRFQQESSKAFQFGFAGVVVEDELMPAPIPMIQWYRKF